MTKRYQKKIYKKKRGKRFRDIYGEKGGYYGSKDNSRRQRSANILNERKIERGERLERRLDDEPISD
tara:strand:- start:375 stop:575 length:201 start_codon:yes stop_codon:yes gene_type:complete